MSDADDLNDLFNAIGFGFPESSEQLSEFNKVFENYAFKANANKIDPDRILESVEPKTVSNVEYHKRTVLAAEIVYRLQNEWSLGHLKLQKLLYLCQNAMNMPIHASFLRQAMGPYDPKLMRSLDKQFEEKKWFKFQVDDFPKYTPLEKAGEHREWYDRYFNKNSDKVDFIIKEFREMKTNDVELVATIFACWMDMRDNEKAITNELLIEAVYKWSKEKAKFSKDDILGSIDWMKKKGIVPA